MRTFARDALLDDATDEIFSVDDGVDGPLDPGGAAGGRAEEQPAEPRKPPPFAPPRCRPKKSAFDARGIFSRKKATSAAVGDLSLSLKELALRQIAKNFDELAAEASLRELQAVAGEMSFWPPEIYEWLFPRLDWRVLFACSKCGLPCTVERSCDRAGSQAVDEGEDEEEEQGGMINDFGAPNMRNVANDELLEAAIRRGEQRYRELRSPSSSEDGSPNDVYFLVDVFGENAAVVTNFYGECKSLALLSLQCSR